MHYPLADIALARRLERAEGLSCRELVEAHAALAPEVGACSIEVGGTLAMYDGPTSPMTQTFGLGMFEPPSPAQLETLETFFRSRRAPVQHETSPIADAALAPLLVSRGYHPLEYSNVTYRPIGAGMTFAAAAPTLVTTRVEGDDGGRWTATAAAGWGELPGLSAFIGDFGRVQSVAPHVHRFLVERDGQAIASGALNIHEGVALLAGAATIPAGRRQGAQLALLDARLRFAVDQGCDLAVMVALPGSGSQRNAERHGFRIAYTRVKWLLT